MTIVNRIQQAGIRRLGTHRRGFRYVSSDASADRLVSSADTTALRRCERALLALLERGTQAQPVRRAAAWREGEVRGALH